MLSNTWFNGQSSGQPLALVQGFGRSGVRLMGTSRFKAGSNSEAQANPNLVTGIKVIFLFILYEFFQILGLINH